MVAFQLNQFNPQLSAKHMSCFDYGIQLETLVARIKNPVELAPACMHCLGHLVFTELLVFHGLFNLRLANSESDLDVFCAFLHRRPLAISLIHP